MTSIYTWIKSWLVSLISQKIQRARAPALETQDVVSKRIFHFSGRACITRSDLRSYVNPFISASVNWRYFAGRTSVLDIHAGEISQIFTSGNAETYKAPPGRGGIRGRR